MSHVALAELACLAAALIWAISLTLFRLPILEHGGRAVNLAKCVLASVLLGATTLVVGQGAVFVTAPPRALGLLFASGVVGMALGDSALFAAVKSIGVYRSFLLQSLAPVFAAALALGWTGERLAPQQALGAMVILGGVVVVMTRKRPTDNTGGVAATWSRAAFGGVALGVAAAFCQGAGIVLTKVALADVPFLAASFLRIAAGVVGLLAMLAVGGGLTSALQLLGSRRGWRQIAGPTFLGTYVAMILMTAGIAWAPASIAAVLLATTPVFSLFVDSRVTGEPITLRSLLGTALAVVGVGILATGS